MTDRMGSSQGLRAFPSARGSTERRAAPALSDAMSIYAIIAIAVVMLPVYLLMVAGSYRASRYHYGS